MRYRFPLQDVELQVVGEKRSLAAASLKNASFAINQNEFTLDIQQVGWFYARGGHYIEVLPYPGSYPSVIEVYLNGSVYGAILHQRKTLPLHGSCFRWKGQGVMLCGESGVGKSSLTTSFCLKGAEFLTDDVTPLVLGPGQQPAVWAISDRVKLWSDSLEQLNQPLCNLSQIMERQGKYYFPMLSAAGSFCPLHHILLLEVHPEPQVLIEPLQGLAGFTALRNEVYRREYLAGMAATEAAYLPQLLALSRAVSLTKVKRPKGIGIEVFRERLEALLHTLKPAQRKPVRC